jgi:hypothetical protein
MMPALLRGIFGGLFDRLGYFSRMQGSFKVHIRFFLQAISISIRMPNRMRAADVECVMHIQHRNALRHAILGSVTLRRTRAWRNHPCDDLGYL